MRYIEPGTYQYTGIPFSGQANLDSVFIAWARLNGRPKQRDFNKSLRAETHDALWFLAKQWQFGELKGENAGTPISVKSIMTHRSVSHYKGENTDSFQGINPIPDDSPLETVIEALDFKLDVRQLSDMGRYYLKLIKGDGASQSMLYQLNDSVEFGFTEIEEPDINSWNQDLKNTNLAANPRAIQMLQAVKGRVPDGWKIYQAISENNSALSNILGSLSSFTDINARYVSWVQGLYVIPDHVTWNSEHLEYRFDLASEKAEANTYDEFEGRGYYQGKFNWYSVDQRAESAGDYSESPSLPGRHSDQDVVTMVPRPAEFPGMPKKRFWEMEDARIDFGALEGDLSEVIKSAVAEYALVYSNDWFVIPHTIPVGTLSKVESILVTDVFGTKTTIDAAIGESEVIDDEQVDRSFKWNMFSLDTVKDIDYLTNDNNRPHDDLTSSPELFIPSTVDNSLESEAVEQIDFIRDEIDNCVWAVESRVFDFIDSSRDGSTQSNQVDKYVRNLYELNQQANPDGIAEPYAELVYNLASAIDENWIPFVPVHDSEAQRSIRLQRASLPRTYDPLLSKIRPTTALLSTGLLDDGTQEEPMYMNEEIVPKTGIRISDSYQRTRWYNGRTYLWYGRKKKIGRQVLPSGLNFDNLEYRSKEEVVSYIPFIPEVIEGEGIGYDTIGVDFEIG